MTNKEIEEYYLNTLTFETYPLKKSGGQSCGTTSRGITLKCEELGFQITVSNFRSQSQNRELCLTLFKLALPELIK